MRIKVSHQHFEFIRQTAERLRELAEQADRLAAAMEEVGQHRLRILHERARDEALLSLERWLADGFKKFSDSVGQEVPGNSRPGETAAADPTT